MRRRIQNNAGEESGEEGNGSKIHDEELVHPRIHTRHNYVSGRMRERKSRHRRHRRRPHPRPPRPRCLRTPNTLNQGESTTLTWQTTNATDVSIDGIGPVEASGTRQVTPTDSTTYHLVAKGAGGTQDATARVTVNAAPRHRRQPRSNLTEEQLFAQNVKDIYFDYDKDDIRAERARLVAGRCAVPAAACQHPHHGRRTLRRARLDRIQPGPRHQSRRRREECADPGRSRLAIASRPSATAKRSRSAPNRTKAAGSKTAAAISCTKNSELRVGDGRPCPVHSRQQTFEHPIGQL